MPIYEYKCDACGATEEHLMKVSDPDPVVCSACGASDSLRKLVSQTTFALKGQGWYVTDYKKSGSASGGIQGGSAKETPAAGGAASTPNDAHPKAAAASTDAGASPQARSAGGSGAPASPESPAAAASVK